MLVEETTFGVGAEELGALAVQLRLPSGFETEAAAAAGLAAAFDAARSVVEARTGRSLKRRAFRVETNCWEGALALPRAPVQAVTGVVVFDADGKGLPRAPEDFRVDPLSAPPRLLLRPGRAAPAVPANGRLVARFEAGDGDAFADAPADLRAATLLLAARWWERAADSEAGEIPAPVVALIEPYRRVRL